MLFRILSLTIAAIALPWSAGAETRIALVIGNSAYPSRPLSSPKDDAKAVEAKLKIVGFQVTRKTDLGRAEFLNAIRDFTDDLQPETIGFFYYSGHGMQVNNRNYMIPIDADIRSEVDVEAYAVPVEYVLARMEAGKGNSNFPNFIILDACRDNPFEKRFKSAQDGLARMDVPSGVLIAFAAAPGKVSEAGFGGKLSLYTEMLVAHIDHPYLDATFMFRDVQNDVYKRSGGRQNPHLDISANLPFFFSFKSVIPATTVSSLQRFTAEIERLLASQSLSAGDRESLKQLRAELGSLSAQILTSAPVSEASRPPIGMAGGDVASTLQQLSVEIEQLLASQSLSTDDADRLKQLMLKRSELSRLMLQIQTSAHEARMRAIRDIRM